jgi:hypothetical protein
MKKRIIKIQDPLVMSFAGGLIKHLGLQMYSGPVPAIAELIANSWDAMAQNVKITLPTGRLFTDADKIIVEDDGHGMTYAECNSKYLVVGRDRRQEQGDLSEAFRKMAKRKVMSRKGIGKLAGFGIASIVEVRTVKDGEITHFRMDFNAMTEGKRYVDRYEPVLLGDNGKHTNERPGTKITLKNLRVTKSANEKNFTLSMARRFAILSDPSFSVILNNRKIKKGELPFQFRYPKKVGFWNKESVPNAGEIKWWAGFTEKPIPDEEARGLVVFARGKLAQAPWFFDISGGMYGQHGMQYMTGEIQADFLDKTGGEDLIATDRANVLWEEDASATALKDWGQKRVKELLKEWADSRGKEKRERPEIVKYLSYGERLPAREKKIYKDYIEKITSIPQMDDDEETLDQLAKFGYNALTNQHFFEMIKQINAASPSDSAKMSEILSQWDIIEAVNAAQQVKGRVEIIRKFEEMIQQGVPEKPDMQDYMKEHPWLLDPAWAPLQHEKSLDTILEKEFKIKRTKTKDGKLRLDYFCLAAGNQCQVIDLKRPGVKVGRKELQQIQSYVTFLREEAKKTSQSDVRFDRVEGILIYSDISEGLGSLIHDLENSGIKVMRYSDLLRRTETLHKDFLDVIKSRAPSNDPRITALDSSITSRTKIKNRIVVFKKKKRK